MPHIHVHIYIKYIQSSLIFVKLAPGLFLHDVASADLHRLWCDSVDTFSSNVLGKFYDVGFINRNLH